MEEYKEKGKLLAALSLDINQLSTKAPVQIVTTGFPFILLPLSNLEAVKSVIPNPIDLLGISDSYLTKDVVVFATEAIEDNNQIHCRVFAPGSGVLEDPATGSAAGPLCAYIERYSLLDNHAQGDPIYIEQGYEIERPSKMEAQGIFTESEISNIVVTGEVKLSGKGIYFL